MGFSVKTIGTIGGGISGGLAGGLPGLAGGALVGGALGGGVDSLFSAKKPGQFPGSNVPKFGIAKTEDFMTPEASVQIGGPNAGNALQRSFMAARDRAKNQNNAALGGTEDALKRRFASIGASGSGAEIAAIQQAHESSQNALNDASQNIDTQEQEQTYARDAAQADMDFKNKVFSFDKASKMHALNLEERQQQISSAENEYNSQVNAFINQPKKPGLLGGLIDNIL